MIFENDNPELRSVDTILRAHGLRFNIQLRVKREDPASTQELATTV
jgi:hypothetical protein